MKKFLKKFMGALLSVSILAGTCSTYTNYTTAYVYAAEDMTLSLSSGEISAVNKALSGKNLEVRFHAPAYSTINALKEAGYTTLSISYNVTNYTADGTAGIMPFVNYGTNWSNGNIWKNLSDGASGTVTLDLSSYSDSSNEVFFGIQFANITGNISYSITSAKLISSGGNSGGTTGGGSTSGKLANSVPNVTPIESNYAKLLQESLYFYDANMCGNDVDEQSEYSWRSDCHTADSQIQYNGRTLDLSGGYHDAGDHAKFALPAAYSASVLGVSYMEYKDAFEDLSLTSHYKRIADRFADYFRRSTIMDASGNVEAFCYQVGDGSADHSYMGIPENQSGSRTAYFSSSSNHCTDAVCETAAALALHYINFGDTSSLDYAKALFNYADNNSKENSVSVPGDLYASSSWADDYAFAAAMLYRATKDEKYRTAYNNTDSGAKYCGWSLSWDDVKAFADIYDPKESPNNNSVASYITNQASSSKKSDGFVNISSWGSARYNAAMQFMGLIYDKNTSSDTFSDWAKGQMSYILGNNNASRCFVIGYNRYSVINAHHRAAYGIDNFQNGNNNPKHLLVGTLVGGPGNEASTYNDNVSNYQETEVALDYNAGLVGAAAALYTYTKANGTDAEKADQYKVDISQITNELRALSSESASGSTAENTTSTAEQSTESTTSTTENGTETTTNSSAESTTQAATEATTGKVSGTDSGELTKYEGTEKTLNIPETVNGAAVVSISEEFLKNNNTVSEIILPDTVEDIEAGALDGLKVYCNEGSKTKETVEIYNKAVTNENEKAEIKIIGDINGNGILQIDDIADIIEYVTAPEKTVAAMNETEKTNIDILFKSNKKTATTAARLFYLMVASKNRQNLLK